MEGNKRKLEEEETNNKRKLEDEYHQNKKQKVPKDFSFTGYNSLLYQTQLSTKKFFNFPSKHVSLEN